MSRKYTKFDNISWNTPSTWMENISWPTTMVSTLKLRMGPIYEDLCVRRGYEAQGQVIIAHSVCRMWLLPCPSHLLLASKSWYGLVHVDSSYAFLCCQWVSGWTFKMIPKYASYMSNLPFVCLDAAIFIDRTVNNYIYENILNWYKKV